jgi:hypothetical protein
LSGFRDGAGSRIVKAGVMQPRGRNAARHRAHACREITRAETDGIGRLGVPDLRQMTAVPPEKAGISLQDQAYELF